MRRAFICIFVLLVVGCGGGDKKGAEKTSQGSPGEGTNVTASVGGVVVGPDDVRLEIPADALSSDTKLSIRKLPNADGGAPNDIKTIGGAYEILPAGLKFNKPVSIKIPLPEDIPDDLMLGLLEAGDGSGIKPLAADQNSILICYSPRAVSDSLVAQVETIITGTKALAFVERDRCVSIKPPVATKTGINDSTKPCAADEEFSSTPEVALKNRHVYCGKSDVFGVRIYDPKSPFVSVLTIIDFQMRFSVYGKAAGLNKKIRVQARYDFRPGEPQGDFITLSAHTICSVQNPPVTCAKWQNVTVVTQESEGMKKIPDTPPGVWSRAAVFTNKFILPVNSRKEHFAIVAGAYADQKMSGGAGGGVQIYTPAEYLRCDNVIGDGGCVFNRAAAVLEYSRGDSAVTEVAEHIWEAQTSKNTLGSIRGVPRTLSPGGLFSVETGTTAIPAANSMGNALHRSMNVALSGDNGLNRNYACNYSESIIRLRPNKSDECVLSDCDCDEYPFSSTWEGAYINRYGTSAKYLDPIQNRTAGARLGSFYIKERLIDLSVQSLNPPPNHAPLDADPFWVTITN